MSNSFFGKIFGSHSTVQHHPEPVPMRSVSINSYSQPHVLQQRMREEELTHGETVIANISPVRLERMDDTMILYFCPLKSIDVVHFITCGDGGTIPGQVQVQGLAVNDDLHSGHYTLRNVLLTSNGTIQVKATEKTVWEQV